MAIATPPTVVMSDLLRRQYSSTLWVTYVAQVEQHQGGIPQCMSGMSCRQTTDYQAPSPRPPSEPLSCGFVMASFRLIPPADLTTTSTFPPSAFLDGLAFCPSTPAVGRALISGCGSALSDRVAEVVGRSSLVMVCVPLFRLRFLRELLSSGAGKAAGTADWSASLMTIEGSSLLLP